MHERSPNPITPEIALSSEQEPVDYSPLIEALRDKEVYGIDSPLTAYVRERVAFLCGDDHEVPDVYVVKDEAVNALAYKDTIVVNDGTFSRLEYVEEMDALLGHELQHITRGHTCQRNAREAYQELGAIRSNEFEADATAMRLLDQRGINPMGVISLGDKLEKEQSYQTQGKRRLPISSPTHGPTVERKITLEQLLTIFDAKHLSTNMQPLHEIPTGQTVTLDSEQFWQLSAPVQQALLKTNVARVGLIERHIAIQEKVLDSLQPGASLDDRKRKAELILAPNRSAVPVADTHGLQKDLELLNQEDVRSLVSDFQMRKTAQKVFGDHLKTAFTADQHDPEMLDTLAEVYNTEYAPRFKRVDKEGQDILHPSDLIIDEAFVASLSERQYRELPTKLMRFAAQTKPFALKYLITDAGAEDVVSPALLEREDLVNRIAEAADRAYGEILKEIHTPLDKLTFIAERATRSDERFFDESTIQWGVMKQWLDTGIAVSSFEKKLISEVAADTPTIIGQIIERATGSDGDVHLARGMARAVLALQRTEWLDQVTRVNSIEGKTKKRELHLQDCWELHLMDRKSNELAKILTRPDGINSTRVHELYETADEDKQPIASSQTIKRHILAARHAEERLHKAHPELAICTVDSAIRGDTAIKQIFFMDALNAYVQGNDSGAEVIAVLQRYGIPRFEVSDFLKTQDEVAEASKVWSDSVELLFSKPNWRENEQDLLILASLGMSAPDIELNLTVADYAFKRIAQLRDFEGCIKLLEEYPRNQSLHGTILQVLIEEKASTADDFERLDTLIQDSYVKAIAENLGVLGAVAAVDSIGIPLYGKVETRQRVVGAKTDLVEGLKSSELLGALLSSGQDDSRLKKYVADRWWLSKRTTTLEQNTKIADHFSIEDYLYMRGSAKRARLMNWLEHDYPAAGIYKPFDNDLSSAYLLTDAARFFAVRKLLLSEGDGILMSDEGGKEIVDALMSSWLAGEEGEQGEVLQNLLYSLLTDNDVATSYLQVAPMLQDMILRQPKEATELQDITRTIADRCIANFVSREQIKHVTDDDRKAIHIRVHRLFLGQSKKVAVDTQSTTMKQRMLHEIGLANEEPAAKKLSTVAFAALVGRKAGSLGVKSLQLAGQYFDLSNEDRKEFEGIYDDMKGQTRLQAYNVMKREAQDNPNVAEVFNSIAAFGPRIAGGSLFTVYSVLYTDGREGVIGVKNPNAEYRVMRLAQFTETGVNGALQQHPGNTTLQLMSSLLEDAVTWVGDELKDEDYPYKDTVFKQENDTLTGDGFKKGNSRYDLITPITTYTGSEWIRAEEFIDGKNLTSLEIRDDALTDINAGIISRDDFKHASSLLVRNAMHQIGHGSFSHSDVHEGNFRITADNKRVAIFDRHNLIPVHESLRQTLKSTIVSVISNDPQGAAFAIARHAAPEGTDESALRTIVENIVATSEPSKLITDMILELKRHDITIPLDLSLILRNFMSVSQFSSKAGFATIAEAFMHTASGPEELNWLMS